MMNWKKQVVVGLGRKKKKKDEKRGLADFAAPFVQSGKRMKGSKGMCHCSSIESKIEKQASTCQSSTNSSNNENRIGDVDRRFMHDCITWMVLRV